MRLDSAEARYNPTTWPTPDAPLFSMSNTEYKKTLIRVTQSFETTCYISFAAPYSLDEQVVLPAGLVLHLHEHEGRDGDFRFEAWPVDSETWAPFIVSNLHRFDKNFRSSYAFNLKRHEIEEHCEPLDTMPTDIPPEVTLYRALQGCLFGTAIGDAIGLPFEGVSARRIEKLKAFPLRHRFLFGRGMLSDDTEHTCMVAHALIFSGEDPDRFSNGLEWSFRWWLLGLPAGIGLATLKACLRLWLFMPATKSGVFSAGNGAAMRSAILGVYAHDDQALRSALVEISTRITHTDPKALKGALIVAEMAARNTQRDPMTSDDCLDGLRDIIDDDRELEVLVGTAVESAQRDQTAREFCKQQGQAKGVGGYIYHTLPVALQIVLRHNDDYAQAVTEAVACGGDTDTLAAIVGGIVGANVGTEGIPNDWRVNLKDWPRDKTYLRLLGDELAMVKCLKKPGTTRWMDPVRLALRNTFFMILVLAHGFRRLLPPY